jgi:hypothetical protein
MNNGPPGFNTDLGTAATTYKAYSGGGYASNITTKIGGSKRSQSIGMGLALSDQISASRQVATIKIQSPKRDNDYENMNIVDIISSNQSNL